MGFTIHLFVCKFQIRNDEMPWFWNRLRGALDAQSSNRDHAKS
jgi:hypothetical protein